MERLGFYSDGSTLASTESLTELRVPLGTQAGWAVRGASSPPCSAATDCCRWVRRLKLAS